MLELAILSFIAGVILTLCVQFMLMKKWLGRDRWHSPPVLDQYPKFEIPQILKEKLLGHHKLKKKEPCLWLNSMIHFLFQESRDSQRLRRWVMKKMNVEFQELLQTTSGRLIDHIFVREYNLGQNFPVVNFVSVKNASVDKDSMEELDLCLDIDYSGGFHLGLDVLLIFNRMAYVSVTVRRLKGQARLQLTRHPYTHWSFSFYQEPEIDFAVESHFEGRPMPQITYLIVNQLRRSVRKKHTLPNFKMRHQPFFAKPVHSEEATEVRVNGTTLGTGRLEVTVQECSRLVQVPQGWSIFCRVSVDPLPWREQEKARQQVWVMHDLEVIKNQGSTVGMTFRDENRMVVVDSISPDTPAAQADVRKNDVVISVGSCKVSSAKHAAKLIRNASTKFSLRIERPQQKPVPDVKFCEENVSSKDVETEVLDECSSQADEEDFINITIQNGSNQPVVTLASAENSSLQPASAAPPGTALRFRPKGSAPDLQDLRSSPTVKRRTATDSKGQAPDVRVKKLSDPGARDRALSDPGLLMKPCGAEADTISVDLRDAYNSESDDEEYCNSHKLREVPACSDPKWNDVIFFDITDQQRFLNVCVWCRGPEKLDKPVKTDRDVLMGCVSLPLGEVCLQCLMTMQGDTRLTVPLKAGEMKAGASRVKNHSSRPGFDPKLCYGDITLSFHFAPTNAKECDRRKIQRSPASVVVSQPSGSAEASRLDSTCPAPSPSKETAATAEGDHIFVQTQFPSGTYCNYCGKKVWLKEGCQCQVCQILCHKKCQLRCQNETLCTRDGPRKRSSPSEPWKTPVSARRRAQTEDRDGSPKSGGLLSKFRKDSSAQPQSAPAASTSATSLTVKSQEPSTSPVLSRRTPSPVFQRLSPRTSPQLPRRELMGAVGGVGADSDSEDEFDSERRSVLRMIQDHHQRAQGQSLDEIVVTAAKQTGKELFAHLSKEERKLKLDHMVSKLQQEIDQEAENKGELCRVAADTKDLSSRRNIEQLISKSDEKMEAMLMLLLHYCAGLQHCLDQEEADKVAVEPGSGEVTGPPPQEFSTDTEEEGFEEENEEQAEADKLPSQSQE